MAQSGIVTTAARRHHRQPRPTHQLGREAARPALPGGNGWASPDIDPRWRQRLACGARERRMVHSRRRPDLSSPRVHAEVDSGPLAIAAGCHDTAQVDPL